MFKNLAGSLTAMVVLGPLVVALAPLFYGLSCMLAFAFPIAFVLSTIEDARGGSVSLRSNEVLRKLLLAVVLVPVLFVAIAAPLRAITVATLSFFPEWMGKFNYMHSFVYEWFVPLFGDLSAYWVDVNWGLLGAGTIFLIALCDSIRRNRLTRQIEVLPTSRARSVAIGLVELKGRAVPLRGQGSASPIIREWRETTGDGSNTIARSVKPFLLDDGTGRILVDPSGVLIKTEKQYFAVGLHQAILKQHDDAKGFPETRLMPGDTVYLIGNVQTNQEKKYALYGDIVVKPKKSSLLSMNFYDLFFLSNISEEALLGGFRRSISRGWRNVFIVLAIGAWLSLFSLTNILQIEASSLSGAPGYLRAITTPTTLEREITVPGVGTRRTVRFMEMLEEGNREKTDAIMRRFEDLQLSTIALPILRNQAGNIDHPGFGITNEWLRKLDKAPRNEWRAEFLDRNSRYPNESRVFRLITRFDNHHLFVSYRAYIDGKTKSMLHEIQKREVVIELVRKETGKKYTVVFSTQPGINASDDMEAFEFLYPGIYELEAYVKTSFRGGGFIHGSRNRKPAEIRLEE